MGPIFWDLNFKSFSNPKGALFLGFEKDLKKKIGIEIDLFFFKSLGIELPSLGKNDLKKI